MDVKQELAMGIAGALALAGMGAGIAAAGSNGSAKPLPALQAPAGNAHTPNRVIQQAEPGGESPEPTGPDTGNIQEGDQTTPDGPNEAPEAGKAPDANEKEAAEQPGTEEPDDANLPGGGHADPTGRNADHEFQGVE